MSVEQLHPVLRDIAHLHLQAGGGLGHDLFDYLDRCRVVDATEEEGVHCIHSVVLLSSLSRILPRTA